LVVSDHGCACADVCVVDAISKGGSEVRFLDDELRELLLRDELRRKHFCLNLQILLEDSVLLDLYHNIFWVASISIVDKVRIIHQLVKLSSKDHVDIHSFAMELVGYFQLPNQVFLNSSLYYFKRF
jgi:hypothetical protein